MKNKGLACILILLLALFAISASVAVPILCRPFYYAHIDALDMPEKTGWTHEQIRKAYDDMPSSDHFRSPVAKSAPFSSKSIMSS